MKIQKTSITTEAKQIQTFIEKNHKIPLACTLSDGTILSPYSVTYLMAKLIKNWNTNNIPLSDVIRYNAEKHNDTINEKVMKEDYLFMITNFLNFCHDNKRVPSYITTKKSKVKVSFELFMYCLAKIVVFYQQNHYLPNYCTFNKADLQNTKTSTTTAKKTVAKSTSTKAKVTNIAKTRYVSQPHWLIEGCNKLGQCTKYYCGVHIIIQMLKKFGINGYTEKKLASFAATTTNGTSHNGILTAIAQVSKQTGIKLTSKWVNFSDMGKTDEERFKAIGKLLEDPNTAVAWHIGYVDGGESTEGTIIGHYEGLDIINLHTKYVRALNSLGKKKADGSYTGRLQDRKMNVQAHYARKTPGNQPAILIVKKG